MGSSLVGDDVPEPQALLHSELPSTMDVALDETSIPKRPKVADFRDVDARRDIITKLYWDEDHDLPEVMKVMESQHDFKATLVNL